MPGRAQPAQGLVRDLSVVRTVRDAPRQQPRRLCRGGRRRPGRRGRPGRAHLTGRSTARKACRPCTRRTTSPCASPSSPTGASPTSAARASTPGTSPRRWSTSATTSRCWAASPTPILDDRVPLHRAAQPRHLQRLLPDADAGHLGAEDTGRLRRGHRRSRSGTFPEPLAFSRAGLGPPAQRRVNDFDLVQDNQCLGYGLLAIAAHGPAGARHHPPPDHRRPPARDGARRDGVAAHHAKARWYAFTKMQTRVARRLDARHHRVARTRPHDIVKPTTASTADRMHVVPVGVDQDLFRPLPGVERIPGRLITTASGRRHDEGPALPARGGGQAAHRARRRAWSSSAGRRRAAASAETIDELGLADVVAFVTGVPDERIIELYSEAELAVVPSLYEGFSLPAIEAMSCGVPAGGHHRRRAARGRRAPTATPPCCVAAGRQRGPGRQDPHGARRPRPAGRIGAAGPPAGHRPLDAGATPPSGTVEQYRALLAETPHQARRPAGRRRAPRSAASAAGGRALTDADRRLRLARPASRATCCSTSAAASAATPSRRFRRGARVVACDTAIAELEDVRGAVRRHGRGRRGVAPTALRRAASNGDATRLPFPDGTFDRIIASRGAGAHPRRRWPRSPSWPGCCKPGRHDGRHRARRGCPRRSAGRCPTSTTRRSSRAATCASTPSPSCARSCAAPGSSPAPPTTPTPCTPRTGG